MEASSKDGGSSSIWPTDGNDMLAEDCYICRDMQDGEATILAHVEEQRARARELAKSACVNKDWLSECKHLLS